MAVCWSFAMVLLLALTALVAPSQPLFQPPAAGEHHVHARENSKAVIENQISLSAESVGSEVKQSWSVLFGRRGRFRRLFQRGNDFVCDEQRNCKRSEFTASTPEIDLERAQTREILANYRLPQKHSTRFQSERMVPTGPNPLHNSNRSQVIFP